MRKLATLPYGDALIDYTAFSPRGDQIVTVECSMNLVRLWRRRRPEYWWGAAWLPEFWLTVVLGAGLVWSLWRDRGLSSKFKVGAL